MNDDDNRPEPVHPAVNPDLYANLDELREGYAPVQSDGWDVLTRNLDNVVPPARPSDQPRRGQPRHGSVGERRYLRRHGSIK